jgi:hypothetical protein
VRDEWQERRKEGEGERRENGNTQRGISFVASDNYLQKCLAPHLTTSHLLLARGGAEREETKAGGRDCWPVEL